MWKLLAWIPFGKIDWILAENDLPDEKKWCWKSLRGTKVQLLTNMFMVWMDYHIVSRSWILKYKDMIYVAKNIGTVRQ